MSRVAPVEKRDKGHVILSLNRSGPIWITPPDASISLPPIFVVTWFLCCDNHSHSSFLVFTLSGSWGDIDSCFDSDMNRLCIQKKHTYTHTHTQISYPSKMGGICTEKLPIPLRSTNRNFRKKTHTHTHTHQKFTKSEPRFCT